MSLFLAPKVTYRPKNGISKVKIYDKDIYSVNNTINRVLDDFKQLNISPNTKNNINEDDFNSTSDEKYQNTHSKRNQIGVRFEESSNIVTVCDREEKRPPRSILYSNYIYQMRSNIEINEKGCFLGPNGHSSNFEEVCCVSPSMGVFNKMTLSIGPNVKDGNISTPDRKNPIEIYVVMLPYDGNNYGTKNINLESIDTFLNEWESDKGVLKTCDMSAIAGNKSSVPNGTKIGVKMVLKESLSITVELGAIIVRPGDLFAVWIRPTGKRKFIGFRPIVSLILEVM